jgi:DNA-binding NarL/FixJ family response regulator
VTGPVPDPPLHLLLVDDHDVVHWGLQMMLSRLDWVQRCRSARTGTEAVTFARQHPPDVALIDLFVGEESGPEICERLHAVAPDLRVLLISGSGQISNGAAAACGASGFISKDSRGPQIVDAVRVIGLGHSLFGATQAPQLPGPALSRRESEVLALIGTGATNQQIAEHLHLSPHTVKEYVSGVYRKLEVRNRAEAVQRATSLGISA